MGAATAMAAAAATAATLDTAFCAEQDTTATGACIERGSGVGWGTGQRRDGGKGDARWGWSEREELDGRDLICTLSRGGHRGHQGRVRVARASADRVPRGFGRVPRVVACAYLGGDLSLGLDAGGHLGRELGLMGRMGGAKKSAISRITRGPKTSRLARRDRVLGSAKDACVSRTV